jgi:hypothetical protein
LNILWIGKEKIDEERMVSIEETLFEPSQGHFTDAL